MVRLKRAYEKATRTDGYRVLVERLWPRGIKKEDLHLDEWMKDIAPSQELRKWYAHDVERWPEFVKRYDAELRTPESKELLDALLARAKEGTLTLVYAASDEEHNSALIVKRALDRRLARAK
jgi:uncharacterized protein YeaO (DUF488 family)